MGTRSGRSLTSSSLLLVSVRVGSSLPRSAILGWLGSEMVGPMGKTSNNKLFVTNTTQIYVCKVTLRLSLRDHIRTTPTDPQLNMLRNRLPQVSNPSLQHPPQVAARCTPGVSAVSQVTTTVHKALRALRRGTGLNEDDGQDTALYIFEHNNIYNHWNNCLIKI